MEVSLIGYEGAEAEELRKAAQFFSVLLFKDKTVRANLHVIIQYDPDLELEGQSFPDDYELLQTFRVFRISLSAHMFQDGRCDPIRTLAHEMVHCKQWAMNEYCIPVPVFRADSGDEVQIIERWLGSEWVPQEGEESWSDSPWEIEAYGREVGLYSKWRNFKKLTDNNQPTNYN